MEDAHIAVPDLNAMMLSSSSTADTDTRSNNGDEIFRFSSEDSSADAISFSQTSHIFDEPIALFGVFDGHGGERNGGVVSALSPSSVTLPHTTIGKEVAKFTQKMYASELMKLPEFSAGNFEEALRKSFHRIDELLEDPVGCFLNMSSSRASA
jgi:serine/threonine protein phosphatase PrpC